MELIIAFKLILINAIGCFPYLIHKHLLSNLTRNQLYIEDILAMSLQPKGSNDIMHACFYWNFEASSSR